MECLPFFNKKRLRAIDNCIEVVYNVGEIKLNERRNTMLEYRSVPLVKQLCDALEREVNNAVRSQGLTYSQIQLLLRLSEVESVTLACKELEERLNVSQATVAGLAKRLEAKGYVEMLDDDADRRVKHVKLTALGAAKCDEAHGHMDAIEMKLKRSLSELEAQILHALLIRVCGNF